MEKVQTGLASGMAAAAGLPKSKPKRPDPRQDGKNTVPLSFCLDARSRVKIATSKPPEVEASHLCIGTWSWGDKGDVALERGRAAGGAGSLQAAYRLRHHQLHRQRRRRTAAAGAKRCVGQLIAEPDVPRDSVVVQTKWHVSPLSPNNIPHSADAPVRALRGSLERLQLGYVDVCTSCTARSTPQGVESVAEGLAACVQRGPLTRAVGRRQLRPRRLPGPPCARRSRATPCRSRPTNQCEHDVLRRHPRDGRATWPRTAPWASRSSLWPGQRPAPATRRFGNYDAADVQPAVEALGGAKGALPVVGVRDGEQARQAVEALGVAARGAGRGGD
ncbi:hypothetical protein Hte_008723 [Hypoxylon texense]